MSSAELRSEPGIPTSRDEVTEPAPGAPADISAATAVLLCSLAMAICWQGAFNSPAQVALGCGLLLTAAVTTLARRPRTAEVTAWPVPALLALAAWTAAGSLLVPAAGPGARTPDLPLPGSTALALAVAVVIVVVRRAPGSERALLLRLLPVLGTLVAVTAWLGLALRIPRWSLPTGGLFRGSGVLTYPNATASLLVVLALLALAGSASAAQAQDRAAQEVIPARAMRLMTTAMLIGAGTTLSRGGLLALASGLAIVLGMGGRDLRRTVVATVGGALIGLVGLLPVTTSASGPARTLALAAPVAGLLTCEILTRLLNARHADRPRRRRVAAPVAVGLLTVLTTGVAGAAVLVPSRPTALTTRFTTGSTYRTEAALAALDRLHAHWWTGAGEGTTVSWRDADGRRLTAHYVHDEYLQVVLEHGAVGGVLLVLVVGTAVVPVRRPVRRPPTPTAPDTIPDRADPVVRVGGPAALVAFAVHSGLDFLWHLPALPLLIATVYAASIGRYRTCPPRPAPGVPVVPHVVPSSNSREAF